MTSVVCQGLQTCLEPPLPESSALTHKSSSNPTQLVHKPKLEPNANNGFSFFNVLEKTSLNVVKNEEVYVHPMVKRAVSALSSISLEMCTESLGTETGSDVSESSDEFGGLERSKARVFDRKMVSRHRGGYGGGGGGGGFPPPLTSISGSDGTVKVNPHRQGGRLVIKAVSVSNCGTKFEAERVDGRLKLSLLKDRCVNVETRRAKMKNTKCCDSDVEGENGTISNRWREKKGNIKKVGGKTGTRSVKRLARFQNSANSAEFRLTTCKDGGNRNKVMKNWSLFRVVIS